MPRWKFALSSAFACLFFVGSLSAQDQAPRSFGTDDYTVTTLSGTSFSAKSSAMFFNTSGSMGVFGDVNAISQWYLGVDLPGGAVIDFIGLNSNTDTDAALTVELVNRTNLGVLNVVGTTTSTPHGGGWDTDINPSPIGYLWHGQSSEALILHVTGVALPTMQFFGWVEIWWHRSVSPAPGTATFGDVPTSHPFFQFIEALAASGITGGCGNNNYCPDAPLTRGQMAVFMAKALGLHWPGAPGLAAPTHN